MQVALAKNRPLLLTVAEYIEFHARGAALESRQIFGQTETIAILAVGIRVSDLFKTGPDHN